MRSKYGSVFILTLIALISSLAMASTRSFIGHLRLNAAPKGHLTAPWRSGQRLRESRGALLNPKGNEAKPPWKVVPASPGRYLEKVGPRLYAIFC